MNLARLLLLLAMSCPSAHAQVSGGDTHTLVIACVDEYALRYAHSKETAGDIADAALSACWKFRAQVVREMVGSQSAVPLTFEAAQRTVDKIWADLRPGIIRVVIEARNKPR